MRFIVLGMLFGILGAWTTKAVAQGFGVYISPPRFEEKISPGQTKRFVLEVHHVGMSSGDFKIYTNDWVYSPNNTVIFSNELALNSCRPWVALERRELKLAPDQKYRFRFEVSAPANATEQECRFAIMLEGVDLSHAREGSVDVPVGGRIGVIVYASVGNAQPQLKVVNTSVKKINGDTLPVLDVQNTGNAHGRFDSFLTAADASGEEFEMTPADIPIMPNEVRSIVLSVVSEDGKSAHVIRYPLQVKGLLDFGNGKLPFDQRFAP